MLANLKNLVSNSRLLVMLAVIAMTASCNNNSSSSGPGEGPVAAGLTVILSATSLNYTTTAPIEVTARFSAKVTGFVVGDVTVVGGTVDDFTDVGNMGNVYTFEVVPASATAGSTVTVNIGANVAAAGTRMNTAAAQLTISYMAPTVQIAPFLSLLTTNGDVVTMGTYNTTAPIPQVYTFSQPVKDFTSTDMALMNAGVMAEPEARDLVSGHAMIWDVSIIPMTVTSGTVVTFGIIAGAVTNAAGISSVMDNPIFTTLTAD